jgi:putative tricarboxylic transport membrane protein
MLRRSLLCILAAAFLPAGFAHSAAPAWKPQNNVEIIVGAGPGGGNDGIARVIQKILQERKLVPTITNVVNKPGGGGGIAYGYLNQFRGSGEYVAIGSNTLLTSHITGIGALNYTDMTPLAIMINEYMSFVVNPDSPMKTGRDLIARLKADPQSVAFGISTSLGNINHIAAGVVARAAGIDPKRLKVVVFNSAGASVTAVLGGHVDVVVGPPSISARHIEAGKLRVIGVTSPKRLQGALANQPVWREQGIDAVVINWRGVLGPRGMSAQQVAFWDSAFDQVSQTDEWNRDLAANLWENAHMNSAGAAQYLKTQYAELNAILRDLGFVK